MLSTLQFSFVLTSTKRSIDPRKKGIKLSIEFLFGQDFVHFINCYSINLTYYN